MKVLITGGDGFCGWPTALHVANRGHDVLIVDDRSRRRIANDLIAQSLTPIASIERRVSTWNHVSENPISFRQLNVAEDYDALKETFNRFEPDAVVHLAAQRSAPYSMRNHESSYYTVFNNILSVQNILHLLSSEYPRTRLVHLGSIGVYGYTDRSTMIPEGAVDFSYSVSGMQETKVRASYPVHPGSLYHTSKAQIGLLLEYYARVFDLDIVDLYQGIVWGTQTPETLMHNDLINRFDYDEFYGTVVNRFMVQASLGLPLTVYGKGNQTRAFIHIADSVRCIEMALTAQRRESNTVQVYHQVAETRPVRSVAETIALHTGANIQTVANPRGENEDHRFLVDYGRFRALGLQLRTLHQNFLQEMQETVLLYRDRLNRDVMDPRIVWGRSRAGAPEYEHVIVNPVHTVPAFHAPDVKSI